MDENNVDIDKLKKIELSMLMKVDEICKMLGIQYFLVGGTLLGAVRHNGFIPWDDDIDIGMLRKDYEIFLREAQQLLPEYYFLQNFHTDPEFPMSFSKIRDSRTTFIETENKDLRINHGVFIDVFPIDYYPERKIWIGMQKFILRLLDRRIFDRKSHGVEKSPIRSKITSIFTHILFPSIHFAQHLKERVITATHKSGKVKNYGGAWGDKEILDARILSQTTMLQFEGYMLPCPYYFKDYLHHIYGDYMKLPPIEKRVSHHYSEIIDLTNSYLNYVQAK